MEKHKQRKAVVRGLAHHCLFWLLVLSLALFSAGCSDSQAKKPKKKNFVQKGDFIHFQLGGEKFKVQKGYFRGGGETQWGALHYAEFWALLPDFEPYDKLKNNYEFVERLGWGRKLDFRIHLREVSRNAVAAIVENHKGIKGHKRFSGRLGKPDEMQYGLEMYRATKYNFDDYLYRPGGNTTVYIRCSSKIMNAPSPSCQMMWDQLDSVYADATFSKDYLALWKEIISNIQIIFNGQTLKGD